MRCAKNPRNFFVFSLVLNIDGGLQVTMGYIAHRKEKTTKRHANSEGNKRKRKKKREIERDVIVVVSCGKWDCICKHVLFCCCVSIGQPTHNSSYHPTTCLFPFFFPFNFLMAYKTMNDKIKYCDHKFKNENYFHNHMRWDVEFTGLPMLESQNFSSIYVLEADITWDEREKRWATLIRLPLVHRARVYNVTYDTQFLIALLLVVLSS